MGEFLLNVTPLSKKSKKKKPKDHIEHMKKFIVKMDAEFQREIHAIYLHFCAWISRMESNLVSNYTFRSVEGKNYANILQYRSKLLMSGYLI